MADPAWKPPPGIEQLEQAITAAKVQRRLKPRDAEIAQRLGVLLSKAGRHDQALPHLEAACRLAPGSAPHLNNLGAAHFDLQRWAPAAEAFRQALALQPGWARTWVGLASALLKLEKVREACEASERAMSLSPGDPWVLECRVGALTRAGRISESVDVLQRHVREHPADQRNLGSLAFHLNYLPCDAGQLLQAHRAFGASLSGPPAPPRRTRDPRRPLRVGILSSDLRSHPVGCFAQAIMRMDPARAQLVAFSSVATSSHDARTSALRARTATWHDVAALPDEALDRLLREADLDVLIELNGLSDGERLAALARKPVARIVTAIGYPNTTGVPAIDARLVDSITDPPGSEAFCTERLLRLDPCFLCFDPPADAPEPGLPPTDAPITFGSFNNMMKISEDAVRLWAGAMRAVPESRLLLKSTGLGDAWVREGLLARFAAAGVDPTRIDACGPEADTTRHLATYRRLHVALDTTPYGGTTTTCEALWMGVPVVTLRGDRHAARVSASLLSAAGHPEWVADRPEMFASIAADLARDATRLQELRNTLRDHVRRSPLVDADAWSARLLQALEDLYSATP